MPSRQLTCFPPVSLSVFSWLCILNEGQLSSHALPVRELFQDWPAVCSHTHLCCGLHNPPAKQHGGRTTLGWEAFKGVLCEPVIQLEVHSSNESMSQARADVNLVVLPVGSGQRCKALYARA